MNKYTALFIFSILLIALLTGCVKYKDGKPVEEATTKEEAPKEEQKAELTLEEKVTSAIHNVTGEEAQKSDGKERIVSINLVDDAVAGEGNKIANIELNADQHSRVPRTRDEILLYSKEIFPYLLDEDNISEVALIWYLPLVDDKGNEEDTKVMQIRIRKDNNINWENFDVYKFESAADQYFEHKALKGD
jgi:hypothetical protein